MRHPIETLAKTLWSPTRVKVMEAAILRMCESASKLKK